MRMRLRSDLCMIGRESDNTLAATTVAREKEVSLHHRPSELPRKKRVGFSMPDSWGLRNLSSLPLYFNFPRRNYTIQCSRRD
ncbi:unnamed protein product [Camellia sinensis]